MDYYNGKTKKQHFIDYIIDTTLLKIDILEYQHTYIWFINMYDFLCFRSEYGFYSKYSQAKL